LYGKRRVDRPSRWSTVANLPDTDRQGEAGFTSRRLLSAALAAAVSIGTLAATESALAKTNPVKKTDPYEVSQKISVKIESKQRIVRSM